MKTTNVQIPPKNMDIKSLVRSNILALKPYSSARDEFTGKEGIFLDANENPYGKWNRYPDPHQQELKKALSERNGIPVENIFIGNGSDEVIDTVYRVFCEPSRDRVVICPPTYGMYEVSAHIHDVELVEIPLTGQFELDVNEILAHPAKVVFVCSPNNPTGNRQQNVEQLLREFKGIVVVDEAYIDFCDHPGFAKRVQEYPNLIVARTFSKAWGLAAARVGIAYANREIIRLMDKTKPPYNVSALNQIAALEALSKPHQFEQRLAVILQQRTLLEEELMKLPIVRKIYPSHANFLLVEVDNANNVYRQLVEEKVIVRNRHSVVPNCIRITVGTPDENRALLQALTRYCSKV